MKLKELTDIQHNYELLQTAIEATDVGITLVKVQLPDFPIVLVNRAFEDLTGYSRHEIIGKNSKFLVGNDLDQAGIESIMEAFAKQKDCKVLLRLYRKSGEVFWNELNLSPLQDEHGVVTYYVGVQTDVTERERIRHDLNRQRTRLEETLAQLHQQTEDNKKLLSLVAHDLRAPLANIQSLNDLAVESKNPEEANRYVQMSSNLAADTRELVSDLLHWRTIERGDFEIQKCPVNLNDFAQSIETYLVHFGARKDIKVELHREFAAETYFMDVKRMQQVISNLVSNAIKYSERGSQIKVSMSSNDDQFNLEVRDYGKGIPADELNKLFKAFEKTSTMPTEGESSFGLGLSIVHKIIEMHGGKVEVESEEGVGTCFTAIV